MHAKWTSHVPFQKYGRGMSWRWRGRRSDRQSWTHPPKSGSYRELCLESVPMSEVTVVFVTGSRVWKVLVARLNDVLLIALNASQNLLFPETVHPKRHLVNEVDDDDAASHSQHMVSSPAESGGLIRGYQHDVVDERGDESGQVDQSVVAFDRASSATLTPKLRRSRWHRSPRQRVRKIIGRAEAAFSTDSGPMSEREVIRGPYHVNQVPFGMVFVTGARRDVGSQAGPFPSHLDGAVFSKHPG